MHVPVASEKEHSFNFLYHQYKDLVQLSALTWCKDPELAKDISQEAMMKLWKYREKLANISNMQGYIFTLVRNLAFDEHHKKQQEQIGKQELLDHYRQFYPPPENERYDDKLFERVFHSALEQLTARQKAVFTLIREEKLQRKQVANILQLSEHTVSITMQRTKKKLGHYVQQRLGISW